jgi:hexokinase
MRSKKKFLRPVRIISVLISILISILINRHNVRNNISGLINSDHRKIEAPLPSAFKSVHALQARKELSKILSLLTKVKAMAIVSEEDADVVGAAVVATARVIKVQVDRVLRAHRP